MNKSPDAFRTIGEVAHWLETPAHVLRFWESRFPEIAPVKRAGGRRYYRPEDMRLLGGIKHLLHDEGKTIKAVQDKLNAEGVEAISALSGDLLPDKSKSEPETKADPKPPTPAEAMPTPSPVVPVDAPAVPDVDDDLTVEAPVDRNALDPQTVPEALASDTVANEPDTATSPDNVQDATVTTAQAVPATENVETAQVTEEPSAEDVSVSVVADDLDDLTASPLFSKPAPSDHPTPTEAPVVSPSPRPAAPASAKGFFFDDSETSAPAPQENSDTHRPAIYLEDENTAKATVESSGLPEVPHLLDDLHDDAQAGANPLSIAAELRGLDVQSFRTEPQQELLRAAVRRLSTALGEEI